MQWEIRDHQWPKRSNSIYELASLKYCYTDLQMTSEVNPSQLSVMPIVLTLLSLRMSLIFSRLFSTWRAKESSLRRGKPDDGRRVGGSTKPPAGPPLPPKLLGRCDGPKVLLHSENSRKMNDLGDKGERRIFKMRNRIYYGNFLTGI